MELSTWPAEVRFLLPIVSAMLRNLTAIRTSCFILMKRVVWVSRIRLCWTERRTAEVMGRHASAFSLKG